MQQPDFECKCATAVWNYADYDADLLGEDRTNGRFGEVSILTCKQCGRKWLHYFAEYEAYSRSGRWYRGLISDANLAALRPEDAVGYLETLDWYIYGGSYFDPTGEFGSGMVRAD